MQLILIFTFSISLTSCCDEHCKAACDSQKSSLDCYKLCECDSLLLVEQNIQTLLSTSNLQNKAIDNFQDKTINTWVPAVITFGNCARLVFLTRVMGLRYISIKRRWRVYFWWKQDSFRWISSHKFGKGKIWMNILGWRWTSRNA